MPLAAGTRLGPYEILSALGAGGMGEVYRARDPRLGRDVAVKVIPGDVSSSPERLRRFEQEARAVAALEHPGILAVHDVGTHEGRPYVVFELLEGETLRERLVRGPIPVRKALELGDQIAEALAAAHARGVVHRDLKPENVFLVREGHVKLLDFGLARLTQALDDGSGGQATRTETDRGAWVGTPGYISPEQLRGQTADARSDIFALGAMLYEMLSGKRAFHGNTQADTLSAILDRDPPPMTMAGGPPPPALERLLRRCFEKDRAERFQSARDVAFALDALSTGSASAVPAGAAPVRPSRRWWWLAAGLLGGAGLLALGFYGGLRAAQNPPPRFKQLTFRKGWIGNARFAPDGRTIVYGAGWDGRPAELFQTRTDSPESRSMGLVRTSVASISSQGQMALFRDPPHGGGGLFGTLAVVPLAGGTPRDVLDNVISADWTPDGRDLCISHAQPNGETAIELPPGTVLDWIPRTRDVIDFVRLSPDGRHIVYRDLGVVKLMLADRQRKETRPLVTLAGNAYGLAWAPSGREVWFTEGDSIGARDVYAVDLEGHRRLVYRSPGVLSLVDMAPDGRALFHRALDRQMTAALLPGSAGERDVSLYDDSSVGALSRDGKLLLLNSMSATAEPGVSTYLRQGTGDPIRLAAGMGNDISPDGRSALVINEGTATVVPIGAGIPRKVDLGRLRVESGAWVPATRGGMLLRGREGSDGPVGLWLIDEEGMKPRRLGVESSFAWAVAPDGQRVATGIGASVRIAPLAGGRPRDIRIPAIDLSVSRWSGDGRSIFLTRLGTPWPCEFFRLDLATEKVEPWKQVSPPDPTGLVVCGSAAVSADGRSYAYSAVRSLASLVVAEGLR